MMPDGMEGKKDDLSRQWASDGPVHALAEPSSRRFSADRAHSSTRSKNVMLETIAPRAYSLDLTRGMGVAGSAVDRTAGSGRPPMVWVQSGPDAGDSTCAGATWSPASLPADYTYHRDDSKHSVVRSEDGEFHLSGYTLHVSSHCEGLMMPSSVTAVPPPEETAVPTVIELSPKETMVRRSMELDSRELPSRRLVEPPIPPGGGSGVECGVEEVAQSAGDLRDMTQPEAIPVTIEKLQVFRNGRGPDFVLSPTGAMVVAEHNGKQIEGLPASTDLSQVPVLLGSKRTRIGQENSMHYSDGGALPMRALEDYQEPTERRFFFSCSAENGVFPWLLAAGRKKWKGEVEGWAATKSGWPRILSGRNKASTLQTRNLLTFRVLEFFILLVILVQSVSREALQGLGDSFLATMGRWLLVLSLIYFILLIVATKKASKVHPIMLEVHCSCPPYIQGTFILNAMILPTSLITLVYHYSWAATTQSYPYAMDTYATIIVGVLLVLTIDIMASGMRLYMTHSWGSSLLSLVFFIYTIIFHYAGGSLPHSDSLDVYEALSWEEQSSDASALFLVTVLVVSPLVTFCYVELSRWRCGITGSQINRAIQTHCCMNDLFYSSQMPDEQAEGCCSCIQHLLYGTDARSVVAFDDFSEHGVGGTPSSNGSPRGKKSSKEKSPKPAILRSQSSPDSSEVARRPPGASLLPYQAATVPQTGVLAASPGNLSPAVTSLLPPTKQKHVGVSLNEQGLAQTPARSISTPVLRAPQSPESAV